jgi:peroxiredoxin Q/BCP
MITVGQNAPDFCLPDKDGNERCLKDYRGKWVVLYFYPKDNTSGCTREACDFRDATPRFDAADAVIVGVSPDSEASHRKFRDKYDLPFVLLADADKKVADLYGVYQEKNMCGKKSMGIVRSTFVIDENGKLAEEMRKVKVDGHVAAVFELIKP